MNKSQRFVYIDALRGIAVLAVIAVHVRLSCPLPVGIFNGFVAQGFYGVQLFYVISAFTLFTSMSVRKTEELNVQRNFFIRRFFRIAPLFYGAIIFYLWRDGTGPRGWLGDAPSITPFNILATATFTNGFQPYWINSTVPGCWSIAVEMMFYIFVPFLFTRIKSLHTALAFTFVTLLITVALTKLGSRIIFISDAALWKGFLYMWLPNQLPIFGLGFVLFFISQRLQSALPAMENRQKKSRLLLVMCAYAFAALSIGSYQLLPVHFLFGLCFVVLAVALMLHPSRIVVNKFTVYLGKISYSAYLTHFIILPFALNAVESANFELSLQPSLTAQYLMVFAMTLGGTMILSALTYHFIEIPGQNLGRRLISALENRRIRTTSARLEVGI